MVHSHSSIEVGMGWKLITIASFTVI